MLGPVLRQRPILPPPLGAAEGAARRLPRRDRSWGRGLFVGANGEVLKAVSGVVQRHALSISSRCDRFRWVRGYSARWRLVLRGALKAGHIKLYCIVYIIPVRRADKGLWMAKEATLVATRPARRGAGGRPTREEAVPRDARLLDGATQLFMERGFDCTSIDAVAETAGVSKPTVYARYHDKRDLFTAVLRATIQRWLAPLWAAAEAAKVNPKSIETALHDLSRHMLAHASTPEVIMLRRTLAAQAVQFPELAKLAHEEGWLRGVRAISILLQQFAERGQIKIDDPAMAADLFLSLVLGTSDKLHGIVTRPKLQELRRQAAVKLFLNGVKPR